MDGNTTIAVVDDEAGVREYLALALSAEGYAVRAFGDGRAALDALLERPPDAVILDIGMPRMDGREFCRAFRPVHPATPILFVSALGGEEDKIEALEEGGDDYIVKPFSLAELLTRLRVCLARLERLRAAAGRPSSPAAADSCRELREGDFLLRPEAWEAEYRGAPLALTVTEYRILGAFLAAPRKVFDRENLIALAYPEDAYVSDRNVDAHIKRLRKKIRALDPGFEGLETVHGIGYRYRPGRP